ncbi:UNVERIFIED_CONTAM: PX domain-containing protein 1 [Gekko kuhli]
MASAVFEGTSLVNMFVRGCWVNGIRRLIINRRGDEEEFFEIRTEWSDRNVLYLHRSYSDLGRLFKRLLDSFPEDRPELSQSPLLQEDETWAVKNSASESGQSAFPTVRLNGM